MRNKILPGLAVLALCLAGLSLYFSIREPRSSNAKGDVVFIENLRVFEAFAMKKEYDALLEKALSADRLKLDSLGASLDRRLSAGMKGLDADKQIFLQYKEAYEAKFGELSGKYTKQVYDRLNSLIQEYGKAHHYRFIMGSGGEGNVMYVDENMNVTEDLIAYINQKYLDN